MKNLLLMTFLMCISLPETKAVSLPLPSEFITVDSTDTVYIHIDRVTINGSVARIPVSMHSDDPINAIDFSFRYNIDSVNCDSIENLTGYLEATYFYNTNDSTMRLTSYSLQTVSSDTDLYSLSFNLQSASVNAINIFNMQGYLNGTACAVAASQMTSDVYEGYAVGVSLFPSPAAGYLYLAAESDINFDIYDISGTLVMNGSADAGLSGIDVSHLSKGLYIISLRDHNRTSRKKFLKQ